MSEPTKHPSQVPTAGCSDDCGAPAGAAETGERFELRRAVRERYGAIAEGRSAGCCDSDCGCSAGSTEGVLERIGYRAEQIEAIPVESNLGLGCGSPLAHAEVAPGETVLDLGSGAGLDVFLAARRVGPAGRAIGVDMTPSMVECARASAARHGVANAEFRLGEIEHLPVADASVDLVISNCVLNLSPDKPRAFAEAFRVLGSGGRLMVSDLVWSAPIAPELKRQVDRHVGCLAGASLREDYLRLAREAGFVDLEIVAESGYDPGLEALPADSAERRAFAAVRSITLRALKP